MSGGGATWHENQLVPVTRHGRLEQVYWTYSFSPIDEDDGVSGVLVVCRDVTEDVLAAVKLRERSRIWNVTQDLLVIVDRNGVWRTVNPAWTRTFGWSEAELLNRTSEWLEHPDDGGLTRMDVGHLIQGNLTVRFESRFRHKDGSYRWLSWTGVPDQDRIFAVARDVTAEKAAAERLKAHRGGLAAVAEDGGGRAIDRRHRARLQ